LKTSLGNLAHVHAYQKGQRINIGVICRKDSFYESVTQELSTGRVKSFLDDLVHGPVLRYELPKIASLNFVYVQNEVQTDFAASPIPVDIFAERLLEIEIEVNEHELENQS